MGDQLVQALEIIGYDHANRSYTTWSFDSHGAAGSYQASLNDRAWTLVGKRERFNGTFAEDRRMLSGTWERSSDGSIWVPWMRITLTKSE
jgi:hypothetical protein